MYVKLYSRILDSSLADDRKLRHFFIDLLLCADPDGNIIMTKQALANRIRSTIEEVEWGLEELMKPDPSSLTPDQDGRRIVPLVGHGYGWQVVNYATYRDYRTAHEMRKATADRVRKFRERRKAKPLPGQISHEKMAREGAAEAELDRHAESCLPETKEHPED